MDWETYGQIKDKVKMLGGSTDEKAITLFSISKILRNGRFGTSLASIAGLSNACPPSSYALESFRELKVLDNISADEASYICLMQFYHRDFLVDLENVDVGAVMQIVDAMITEREVSFPDRHGRVLHDRYLDKHGARRSEFLTAEESDDLTYGEKNGVYQVGRIVVGPLGLLLSVQDRFLPPNEKVPLWHCADPGCGVLHLVELHSHESAINSLLTPLTLFLRDVQGPASDWDSAFTSLVKPDRRQNYFDILPLLSDAFNEQERHLIFLEALAGINGKTLRETISTRLSPLASRGSRDKVAAGMSGNEIIHLLSTLDNLSIVRLIDKLVISDRIVVPKSEVRRTRTPVPMRKGDLLSAISSLGVRANKKEPASYLAHIIFNAYDKTDNRAELAWRCKANSADTASILAYVATVGPRRAISDLVMPSEKIFSDVCAALSLDPTDIPDKINEDNILWKAGFTVSRYENFLSLFRNSLRECNEAVVSMPTKANDLDREKIRAVASNVFVYAERFMQDVVSFNAWLLFFDHFGVGRFEYRQSDALESVRDVCGSPVDAGGNAFHWDVKGGNTLGTLLVYGRKLVEKLSDLPLQDKTRLERPEQEYPHYASTVSVRFPFKHLSLWADASPESLSEYTQRVERLISTLEKAKIAEIRNGVQHYRDQARFPSREAMLEALASIIQALDFADIGNLVPKQYWADQHGKDAYGISRWSLVDYNSRKVDVVLPYAFTGMITPSFAKAYVVEGGAILGPDAGKLIFQFKESSNFTAIWDDFDRVTPVSEVSADSLAT